MFADAAFRERVCAEQGSLRTTMSLALTDEGGSALIEQLLPVVGIPSYAAKFVGEQIEIRRHETWHDTSSAAFALEIPGKPGGLTGTLKQRAESEGTGVAYDGDLSVNLPFVGGKIERLVADLFTSALEVETQVARAYLSS